MESKPLLRFHILGLVLAVLVFRAVDSQPSDGEVMADLKKGLVLPKGLWEESDYCSWGGVRCDRSNRVIRIQLKNHVPAITGELPSSLGNLTELGYLELRQTNIGGPLPTLKGLGSLTVIMISENNFTSIPNDFFEGLTMLESVYIDKLPLAAWEIPASLQSCSSLKNFSANSANIHGKIPKFFNSTVFPNLVNLHMAFNFIEGGLPPSMASLTTLQTLWLNGQKNFSGTIEVLGSLKSLMQIWVNMNSLTGPLPDFSGFDFLWDLNLRDNQFTGPVPGSLMTVKSLKVVNLTNNLLQGPVPVFDKSVEVDMNVRTNSFCLDTPGECSDDVYKLLSIAKNLGYPLIFARAWKGNNPCVWPGITCPQGKIGVINFQKKDLTGTISPNFSLISSLQTLNLANNNLYGTIPTELTKLPELKLLDLSNNHLSGDIPPFKNVNVKTDNNPDIGKTKEVPPSPGTPPGGSHNQPPGGNTGGSPGGGRHKNSPFPVGATVAGVIGGACFIFVIGLITFCLCKRKRKAGKSPKPVVIHPHHSGSDPDMVKITVAGPNVNVIAGSETCSRSSGGTTDIHIAEAGSMVISIQVLRDVTDNFSKDKILGRGGFATVYRGDLPDGTTIAVKRMETGVTDLKGLNEFKSEIDILNKVRHRHLVSLIGYYLDANERILVYEYMPQGTLSRYLFNWEEEDLRPLDWTRRLSIALDVGRGVEYLHGLASQSFIHRDLKPSNILLGDDMKAKVADFGLVRLAPEGKASVETRLAGTFGYLAPEYAATGRVTTKVDIYAFGVILMELITGRKALDESLSEDSVHLVTWFRRMCGNQGTCHKAIDPRIAVDEETLMSIQKVTDLARYCCASDPQQRPDMGHVVNVLSSLVEHWKPAEIAADEKYTMEIDYNLAEEIIKWQAKGNTGDVSSYMENTQSSQDVNQVIFPSVSGR